MARSVVVVLALFLIGPHAVWAQTPDQLRQGPDGSIWIVTAEGKVRVVPMPITDEELAQVPDRQPPSAVAEPPAVPMNPGPWLGQVAIPSRDDPSQTLVVTAHSMKDPETSTNRFNQPKGRWVVVEWEAHFQGSRSADASNVDLRVQTADGFVVDDGNHAGLPEPEFDLDVLGPDQRVRGYLAYDVPAGQRVSALIAVISGRPQIVVAQL